MAEFQLKPVDIAGKIIDLGDKVAFCTAGKSSDMRIGEVIQVTPRQVKVAYSERKPIWDVLKQDYNYEWVDKTVLRHSNNVAKV